MDIKQERKKNAKLNVSVSLLYQAVTVICGLTVPRLLLNAFGSEMNGAAASILQFTSYISLLEGGIGGVARAAMYKPISLNDTPAVSRVLGEVQHFFRLVALFSLAYITVLAAIFKNISHFELLDWASTALLVFAVSLSIFPQYFFGLSYSLYINAAQKAYVVHAVSAVTVILNAVLSFFMIKIGADFIAVKMVSCLVFIIKPIILLLYVRKKLHIRPKYDKDKKYLSQKWTGLGQHIAYFFHSNTDVVLLTLFADLKVVYVYEVYHMVISHIQNFVMSFSSGMEAIFGSMIAGEENELLQKTVKKYEVLISVVSNAFFVCTAVLIVPFVSVYTKKVTDVNYCQPLFSLILCSSAWLYCLRLPLQSLTVAAGHFKQTRFGAYGEAVINIVSSVILINCGWDLTGVATGTVLAVLFRFIYYIVYLRNNIISRPVKNSVLMLLYNTAVYFGLSALGRRIIGYFTVDSFIKWIICACAFTPVIFGTVYFSAKLIFPNETKDILSMIIKRKAPEKSTPSDSPE